MAKYRLSYLGYGGYKSVDLEKLECLSGRKVTDIQVIDEFTTSFENREELLNFLKRNKVIDNEVNSLVITVDKKENGETINKKIYRGENLLFKDDKKFLDMSFIYKWIMYNTSNEEALVSICENYIEKYKNAYNRITGSSYILSTFSNLRDLSRNKDMLTPTELREFDENVRDFISIEFYKIDKDELMTTGRIERKKEDNGEYKKSYRNIHDFVILLKVMGLIKSSKLANEFVNDKTKQKSLVVEDNCDVLEIEEENIEEFLTEEDVMRTTKMLISSMKDPIYEEDEEVYRDGAHDFCRPYTVKEIETSLYESGMKLVRKNKTGDLK